MDSLTSIELRNRLQSSLACRLPTTFVFDCPNTNAVVDYLCERVLPLESCIDPAPGNGDRPAVPAESSPEQHEGLDDLTANELETLLDKKLAEIEEGGQTA